MATIGFRITRMVKCLSMRANENGKISKDKNGNFYYSNMWWVRKGTSPKFALFAQPHVFSGTTDVAYACSGGDSIGYAYLCLSSESNKIKVGNPSYYSQTPLYFNKGDYIFFTAWIFDGTYKGDALGFGGYKMNALVNLIILMLVMFPPT